MNMDNKRIRKNLAANFISFKRTWFQYVAILILSTGIMFNLGIILRRPLIMQTMHPLHFIFVIVNIVMLLSFFSWTLEAVIQRDFVRLFRPYLDAVNNLDCEQTSYMEYNQLFSMLHPLSENLTELKRKNIVLLFCSRYVMAVTYLLLIGLTCIAGFIYSQVQSETSLYVQIFLKVMLVIYLIFILYYNGGQVPEMPGASRCLFFLIIAVYLLTEVLARWYEMMLGQSKILYSSFFEYSKEFSRSMAFLLLIICLYYLWRFSSGRMSEQQRNIQKCDTFFEIYIELTTLLYELEEQEDELVSACRKASGMINAQHLSGILYQRDRILELYSLFTQEMCDDFIPAFWALPDWMEVLFEDDFEEHVILLCNGENGRESYE